LGGQNCPKCGSDQVLNDQCLKCGIVISKFQKASQPVSFVAPSRQSHKEHSYTISKETLQYEQIRKKQKLQTLMIGIGILAVLALIAAIIWHFLSNTASVYSGVYKNSTVLYGIFFPDSGAKWYHGRANNLEDIGLKDPIDAFYRGEDRDDPDLSFVVFQRSISPVPEKLNEQQKDSMLEEEEDLVLKKMKENGVSCEIVDSGSRNVGGSDGFYMEAEIKPGDRVYRAFILNGYYFNRGYTLFFVGPDEKMEKQKEYIEQLMNSFTFKTSVI
jgi:transcription initiation factor TFIIIB Brf1 subunit/transcription initiation factor TFIIB